MKKTTKIAMACGIWAALGMTLVGCATNAATGKQDLMLVSSEKEVVLSTELHEQLSRSSGFYSDEKVQGYLRRVGDRIAAMSERKDIEYRFLVLDTPDVNAFALPDGRIYVTRGLLAFLESEAELAAVLSHEVAHVATRHGSQLLSSARMAGAVSTVLGVIAGAAVASATGDMNLAMSTMDVTSGASAMASLQILGNYSRDHELEADRLGGRYLARASYSQDAMADVLGLLKSLEKHGERRKAESGSGTVPYHRVATHPELEERIEKIAASDTETPPVDPLVARKDYLQNLSGLLFQKFDDGKPEISRQNVFFHRDTLFQGYLPPGWAVVETAEDRVSLENAGEQLSTRFRLLPPTAEHDAEKFLSEALPDAAAIRDVEALNPIHHKVPAFSAAADMELAEGVRIDYVAVIFHDKYTILMTGKPKDAEWLKTRKYVFNAQANLVKLLTQEEYDRQRFKRIQVVEVGEGDTYAALAESAPLGDEGEAYLRLLNRQYPDGEPVPGQLIKVVVPDP